MRQVQVNGHLVQASPNSPPTALCPFCGCPVHKRQRRNADGLITYFYRHQAHVGDHCPKRYRPVT